MSVFGSRSDDPLLEDDPLAPSADEEEETADESSSETSTTDRNRSSSNGAPQPEDSVFGRTASTESDVESKRDAPDSREGREESRVLVRSTAEAANGALAALNEALDDGWRMDRVELNEVSAAEREAAVERPSTDASLTLAFVLRRSGGE